MAFLENLEYGILNSVNPKVEKIIEEMKKDPEHQALMKRLAEYEERLKHMEEHGI